MRLLFYIRILLALILIAGFPSLAFSQASCALPGTLTPSSTCTVTKGDLFKAANAAPTGSCGGATATTTFGVWYQFTATSTNTTITVNNLGSNLKLSTTYLQVFSGTCGSLNLLACQDVTSRLHLTNLTIGDTYFVRIYVTSAPTTNPSNKWNFDICIQNPPANDNCGGAILLTSNSTCSNFSTTMDLATPTTDIAIGCGSSATYFDVWYKFVATSNLEVISLGNLGANIINPSIQLYSGTCSTLTSIACGTTSITASNLTAGNTYFVRVSNTNSNPSGIGNAANFSICVYRPTPAKVDFSRSYINVSKGSSGGTVDVGDTLEMRATLVVSSKMVDSLSFMDTLYNTKGLRLIPGSIALRTNEGKIYGNTIGTTPSPFTDAYDGDAGWQYTNGLDTVIRINFGTGASNFKKGQLSSTSRPSVFNNTCIIMATYRVVVYAEYNTKINFKTGALTFRDPAVDPAGTINKITFSPNHFIVYQSPGLCPNAVSATNALGAEFNGTFGGPAGTAPLARNRGTSPYTNYTYSLFSAAGGPQDYFYGIANNTSSKYTTLNNWAKPDANGYRVFQQWDITGDHTGAADPILGNPACDTTKPVSSTNPCGYMLVINSAYRADTAFTYTVNNLCPNTFYELSAWFKNICYKCGCDSTGTGSGGASYIPTAPNDSSGVRPNIAFDVNGTDYYTTGDILYYGTTPTGSDATNKWVKRGFTYLTGPNETSFTLTIRNNAPGGGGNDWAMDDISIATCLPNMKYSPTLNPIACQNNVVSIYDTVRSYFNNYKYYKWQQSSDGGATWKDVTGQIGSSTPTWNGTEWEYITSYTIPPASTKTTNNGDKYRVTVATTETNLLNDDCQFTDGISIINLTVLENCTPLEVKLLSFNGKVSENHSNLSWTISRHSEPLSFYIEKSFDGINFTRIAMLKSNINKYESQSYSFKDPSTLSGRAWYRIALINEEKKVYYSNNISLINAMGTFEMTNVTNPFKSELLFNVEVRQDAKIEVALLSASGNVIKRQSYLARTGVNSFSLQDLAGLPHGIYLLQIQNQDAIITKKVVKN